MTDFAEIGIVLDSRPVAEGTKALDALSEASVRVEQKVGALNGQMSDTVAIMRKNAEASSVASQAAQQFLAPLQREIDMFGMSRAEAERYNAAKANLSAAAQRQAAALGAAIDAMQRDEKAARDFAAAEDYAAKAADQFVKKLQDQVAIIGMNTTQLHAYRAAQLGVSDAAAPLIAKLAEVGGGAHTAGSHVDGLSFASVGARRELLVLAHEMSQGNFQKFGGSMMVLGEQTGAAGLLFSAAGLAALGLIAAVGGVAYAMIKGASEQKHMNDALVMTGNYAGMTSDSLNELAHAAVTAGGSIGEAKKVTTELAGSGKFTGDQIGYITEATVAWEHATGQSVKSIIKDFESLAVQTTGNSMRATEAISRATVKLDDQYHFLTESVYEQIRALEKDGQAKDASALATETFAKVTHDRAEEVLHNLGSIARGWNGIKEAIGGAVDAMGNWGKKATPGSIAAGLSGQLSAFDNRMATDSPVGRNGVTQAQLDTARLKIVMQLTTAMDDLNKADAAGIAEGKATMAQSEAIHAASRIAADDAKLQKKGMSETKIALDQYHEDIEKIKAANPDSILVTPGAIAAHEAAIIKAHTVAVKGNDDRSKTLQDALVIEQTGLDREKSIYDAREKMLGLYHSKFGMSDADFYSGRGAARAEYVASEAIAFAKESALVQGYKPKNAEEIAANKTKYDELVKQHLKFVDDMRNAGGDDSATAAAAAKKSLDDIVKATHDAGIADIKKLDDAITKQREHNAEIGKTREQIDLSKKAIVDLATAQIESDAEFIRSAIEKSGFDDTARAVYGIRLSDLDAEIARRKELAGLIATAATLDAGVAAAAASRKLVDQQINDWKNVGSSIADSLSSAFGTAGKAAGSMFKAYADNMARQGQLNKEMANAKLKLDGDPTKLRDIDSIQRQSSAAQLKSYGDMADAAEGFFEKGSKGYQAMHAASVIMHAAEMAMNLASIAPAMAAGAAQFFAESGWGGFAGVAAMAAVVAGFGVAVSSSGSGGGQSAADVQKTQGTGSVFGDSTAKSDSIARSIALASANSSIELTHTAGMLASLKNIESSMSGLTNLIVRTPGVTDGSNMGIQTGTLSRTGSGTVLTTLGAAGGAAYGATAGAILGPLGMAIGALGGAIIGKLASLWGSTKQNVVDSGLQFGGSVRGLESGQGFNQYASVDTTKSSWFGLSKSTSNSVQTQGIGNELSSQFGLVFTNLETSLKAAAVGLGGSAAQVGSALDNLTLSTSKISLKGLTGDALTSAINGVMSKAMDEMAQAALPGYDKFRKVGEGYAETVTRVSTDFVNVGSIFESMGKSLVTTTAATAGATGNIFSGWFNRILAAAYTDMPSTLTRVTTLSVEARERLIDLAGGIDKMASQANSFTSNYLSQAEQMAPVTKYVSDEMSKLGYSSINTRDQFKDLVLGLDVTTQKGAEQYTSLMALADAFAKTHAAAADLTKSTQGIADERKDMQDELDKLTMSSTQMLAKQRNALDASNRGIFDQIQAATKLKDAQDLVKKGMDETITKLKSFAESSKKLHDGLLTGSLTTLAPEDRYAELRNQYEKTKSLAMSGDATAQSGYASALNDFLTFSQKINSADSQYASDFAMGQKDSEAAAQWASAQVDVSQASLDALKLQGIGIDQVNATLLDMAKGIADLPGALASASQSFNTGNYTSPSNSGMAVLADAVKSLQASNDALREEVKGLRADQNKQTGTAIAANAEVQQANANTIVGGIGGLIGRVVRNTKAQAELE